MTKIAEIHQDRQRRYPASPGAGAGVRSGTAASRTRRC